MDNPVVNPGANDNNISGGVQFAPEIGDKNDNVSLDTNVYIGDKTAAYGDQNEGAHIELNLEKQITDENVQYIQDSDGNYLVQSTSGYCLVTTENTIVTTSADENIYTSAQTHTLNIGYESQPNTEQVYINDQIITNEYISNEPIDQDNFVSQYIQEAQAGSQYQIAATDNYLLPAGQGDSNQANVTEQQNIPTDYQGNDPNSTPNDNTETVQTTEPKETHTKIVSQDNVDNLAPENGTLINNTTTDTAENIELTENQANLEAVQEQPVETYTENLEASEAQEEVTQELQTEPVIEQKEATLEEVTINELEQKQDVIQEEENVVHETIEQQLVEQISEDHVLLQQEVKSNGNGENETSVTEEIANDSQIDESTNNLDTPKAENFEHYLTEGNIIEETNASSAEESSKEGQIIELDNEKYTLESFHIPDEIEVTTVTSDQLMQEYDGTMVHVATNDEHEVVLIQCYEGDEQADDPIAQEPQIIKKSAKSKLTRRVRTGDSQAVPPHVLGVDIQTPVDPVNGKKPRLGVKVPCKNLQSQIISKDELQKEIMSRVSAKSDSSAFAKKLTSRLAKKLGGGESASKPVGKKAVNNNKADDNADLLAILEGNDSSQDEIKKVAKEEEKAANAESEESLKQLEKEIALQQLQEFPLWSPKLRVISRGGMIHKPQNKNIKSSTPAKKESTEITVPEPQQSPVKKDVKPEIKTPKTDQKLTQIDNPKTKKEPVEVESQVKVNMVLKTYSRKRKTSESDSSYQEESPVKKVAVDTKTPSSENISKPEISRSGDGYVTKSSRIIKKKVIWDPAETSTKKKIEPTKPTKTVETKKNEKKEEVKVLEKPKKSDVKPQEKKVEKKADKLPEKPVNNADIKKASPKKIKSPMQKKRLTEVDKLLMDEGALNMLCDVKDAEEGLNKNAKSVLKQAKANKEMMKRANEIKNDFQQTASPDSSKSLRKKDSPPSTSPVKAQPSEQVAKKKGKDIRSSGTTPPASPAFTYSESSRLIRRRSSSSISSDSEIETDNDSKANKRKSSNAEATKAKKVKKATKEATVESELTETKTTAEPKPSPVASSDKSNQFKSFTYKKSNKIVSLDLQYVDDNCHCTLQVLKELTQVLKQISKDKDCAVVSITSSGKAFCLGLDYKSLLADNVDARKKKALELVACIKDFLKCLLNFPKVLVAGIQGDCVGLGVTMLPLFDIVIASDSASFSTTYSKLGCVAEGGFLLAPPFQTNRGLASELLYSSNKIKADDASRRGLITRVCWPEKYNDELKSLLGLIAKGSRQSLESNKKLQTSSILKTAEAAITAETNLLVEHWISDECQTNFLAFA